MALRRVSWTFHGEADESEIGFPKIRKGPAKAVLYVAARSLAWRARRGSHDRPAPSTAGSKPLARPSRPLATSASSATASPFGR